MFGFNKDKNPVARENNDDFDDDMFSKLDDFDGDVDDYFGEPSGEAGKDGGRSPITKNFKTVTSSVKNAGNALVGGAAHGIGEKIDNIMPEVGEAYRATTDILSEYDTLKREATDKIRPSLNATKLAIKRYTTQLGDLPFALDKKILHLLGDIDEERSAPSKDEIRDQSREQAFNEIFKLQEEKSMEQQKEAVVNKALDRRINQVHHGELAGLTNIIKQQEVFQSAFIKSTFTAFLKKDLELKYKHLYVSEDMLGVMVNSTKMLEERLDAIKLNTALPDSNKIYTTEMARRNLKEKFVNDAGSKLKDWFGGARKKIMAEYVEPFVDGLDMGETLFSDMAVMLEALDDAKESGMSPEDMGLETPILSKDGIDKGALAKLAFSTVGKFGGRKLATKIVEMIPARARRQAAQYLRHGKAGFGQLIEDMGNGRFDGEEFEIPDFVKNFIATISPDRKNNDSIRNITYDQMHETSPITNKFITTVETIIPGYLKRQTRYLAMLAGDTKNSNDFLEYDFKKQDFRSSTDIRNDAITSIIGTREERIRQYENRHTKTNQWLQDATSEISADNRARVFRSFKNIDKDIEDLKLNLAYNQKGYQLPNVSKLPTVIDQLSQIATYDAKDTESVKNIERNELYVQGFRKLRRPQEVASALLGIFQRNDGPYTYSQFRNMIYLDERLSGYMANFRKNAYEAMQGNDDVRKLLLRDIDENGNGRFDSDKALDLMQTQDFGISDEARRAANASGTDQIVRNGTLKSLSRHEQQLIDPITGRIIEEKRPTAGAKIAKGITNWVRDTDFLGWLTSTAEEPALWVQSKFGIKDKEAQENYNHFVEQVEGMRDTVSDFVNQVADETRSGVERVTADGIITLLDTFTNSKYGWGKVLQRIRHLIFDEHDRFRKPSQEEVSDMLMSIPKEDIESFFEWLNTSRGAVPEIMKSFIRGIPALNNLYILQTTDPEAFNKLLDSTDEVREIRVQKITEAVRNAAERARSAEDEYFDQMQLNIHNARSSHNRNQHQSTGRINTINNLETKQDDTFTYKLLEIARSQLDSLMNIDLNITRLTNARFVPALATQYTADIRAATGVENRQYDNVIQQQVDNNAHGSNSFINDVVASYRAGLTGVSINDLANVIDNPNTLQAIINNNDDMEAYSRMFFPDKFNVSGELETYINSKATNGEFAAYLVNNGFINSADDAIDFNRRDIQNAFRSFINDEMTNNETRTSDFRYGNELFTARSNKQRFKAFHDTEPNHDFTDRFRDMHQGQDILYTDGLKLAKWLNDNHIAVDDDVYQKLIDGDRRTIRRQLYEVKKRLFQARTKDVTAVSEGRLTENNNYASQLAGLDRSIISDSMIDNIAKLRKDIDPDFGDGAADEIRNAVNNAEAATDKTRIIDDFIKETKVIESRNAIRKQRDKARNANLDQHAIGGTFTIPDIDKYGGVVDEPTEVLNGSGIAGEAGDESIIPHRQSERSKKLIYNCIKSIFGEDVALKTLMMLEPSKLTLASLDVDDTTIDSRKLSKGGNRLFKEGATVESDSKPEIKTDTEYSRKYGITTIKDILLNSLEVQESTYKKLSYGIPFIAAGDLKELLKSTVTSIGGLSVTIANILKHPFNAAWSGVKTGATWTGRNIYSNIRDTYTNRVDDIFLAPTKGETLENATPLVTASQFASGLYADADRKKLIKSISDIKGPCWDKDGNEVITNPHIVHGLVTRNGQPLRNLGGKLGRLTHNLVAGGAHLAGAGMYKGWNKFLELDPVEKLHHAFTIAKDQVVSYGRGLTKSYVDVYSKRNPKKLLAKGELFKQGLICNADGKIVPTVYNIKEPCYLVEIDEQTHKRSVGNICIEIDDINAGLIDSEGKDLELKLFGKLGNLTRRIMHSVAGGILTVSSIPIKAIGWAWDKIKTGTKEAFTAKDPYIDVYIVGADKKLQLVIKGDDLKTNAATKKYIFRDSKNESNFIAVKSAYEIDKPVYILSAENVIKCVISEDDLESGVFDAEGNKLTRWRGRSLAGKVATAGFAAAGWVGRKLISIGKGAVKLVGSAFKKVGQGLSSIIRGGAELGQFITGMLYSVADVVTSTLITRRDLNEIVGDRLVDIYGLLERRLPKNADDPFDKDGDGDRDGSYQDYIQRKNQEHKKSKSKHAEDSHIVDKDGNIIIPDAYGENGESGASDGGSGGLSMSDILTWMGMDKAMSYVGGKLSAGKRRVGNVMRSAGTSMRNAGARALGAFRGKSGLLTKLLSGAKGKLAGVGAAFSGIGRRGAAAATRTTATAAGAGGMGARVAGRTAASTIGRAVGKGLAKRAILGIGARLAAMGAVNLIPGIGQFVSLGLLAWTAVDVISGIYSLATDTPVTKKLRTERFKAYGISTKYWEAIEDLETDTWDSLQENNVGVSTDRLRIFGEKIDLIKNDFNTDKLEDEKIAYLKLWYDKRFIPVYSNYTQLLKLYTTPKDEDPSASQPKADDIAPAQANEFCENLKVILEQFITGKISILACTTAGFVDYMQAKREHEQKHPKDKLPNIKDDSKSITSKLFSDAGKDASYAWNELKHGNLLNATIAGVRALNKGALGFASIHVTIGSYIANQLVEGITKNQSLAERGFNEVRWELYGIPKELQADKADDLIELETLATHIIDGERPDLDRKEIREWAYRFFSESDLRYANGALIESGEDGNARSEIVSYFGTWWSKVFKPVYMLYAQIVRVLTGQTPGDNIEPEEIPNDNREEAIKGLHTEGKKLIKNCSDIKLNIEAFTKWLTADKTTRHKVDSINVFASDNDLDLGSRISNEFNDAGKNLSSSWENLWKGNIGIAWKQHMLGIGNTIKGIWNSIGDIGDSIGTTVASWFYDSAEKLLWDCRFNDYGLEDYSTNKIRHALQNLEEVATELFDGQIEQIDPNDLSVFAKDIGFIPLVNYLNTRTLNTTDGLVKNTVAAKKEYLQFWFNTRFLNVFNVFAKVVTVASERVPGEDIDLDAIHKSKQEAARKLYQREVSKVIATAKEWKLTDECVAKYFDLLKAAEEAERTGNTNAISKDSPLAKKIIAEKQKKVNKVLDSIKAIKASDKVVSKEVIRAATTIGADLDHLDKVVSNELLDVNAVMADLGIADLYIDGIFGGHTANYEEQFFHQRCKSYHCWITDNGKDAIADLEEAAFDYYFGDDPNPDDFNAAIEDYANILYDINNCDDISSLKDAPRDVQISALRDRQDLSKNVVSNWVVKIFSPIYIYYVYLVNQMCGNTSERMNTPNPNKIVGVINRGKCIKLFESKAKTIIKLTANLDLSRGLNVIINEAFANRKAEAEKRRKLNEERKKNAGKRTYLTLGGETVVEDEKPKESIKTADTQLVNATVTTPKKFANGGTIINGVDIESVGGIVNKPTEIINGKGIAGEAGSESIIPHKSGSRFTKLIGDAIDATYGTDSGTIVKDALNNSTATSHRNKLTDSTKAISQGIVGYFKSNVRSLAGMLNKLNIDKMSSDGLLKTSVSIQSAILSALVGGGIDKSIKQVSPAVNASGSGEFKSNVDTLVDTNSDIPSLPSAALSGSLVSSAVTGYNSFTNDISSGLAKLTGGTAKPYSKTESAEKIWNYFKDKGWSDEGTAAIMGNLDKESGLEPIRKQNDMSADRNASKQYLKNSTKNPQAFIKDSIGWGIAQWTYYIRKEALVNAATQAKKSLGDLDLQLDFLYSELMTQFKSKVTNKVMKSKNLEEATIIVLKDFEAPAAKNSPAEWKDRISRAMSIYKTFTSTLDKTMNFASAAVSGEWENTTTVNSEGMVGGVNSTDNTNGSLTTDSAINTTSADGTNLEELIKKEKPSVDTENLHPETRKRLAGLAKDFINKFDSKLVINSGKRSMEEQARLKQKYGAGAASPSPTSPHISGLSIDANSSQLNKADEAGLLSKNGLYRPLKDWSTKKEPWHVEPVGSRNSATGTISEATIANMNAMAGTSIDPNVGTDKSTTDLDAIPASTLQNSGAGKLQTDTLTAETSQVLDYRKDNNITAAPASQVSSVNSNLQSTPVIKTASVAANDIVDVNSGNAPIVTELKMLNKVVFMIKDDLTRLLGDNTNTKSSNSDSKPMLVKSEDSTKHDKVMVEYIAAAIAKAMAPVTSALMSQKPMQSTAISQNKSISPGTFLLNTNKA